MKILGRISSINVRKVLWTADELGLAYTREDWGLPLRDPKVPDFLALNPNAQVPVLVEEGGFVLWESHAIMRYLSARGGVHRLMPPGAHEAAIADQWLTWGATELNPAWSYAFSALVRHAPGHDDPAAIETSRQRWTARMQLLDDRLAATGAYAGGAEFTLADITLGLSVHRWFGTPMERPALPHIDAYYARLQSRPAARAWLDPAVP
ncbi:Glutathione S-transferase GstB [Alphaproteobacteria bacterium SO-S41]|nr:Glutathione S-transferase GstB [Alphaproteobacteria bacterium SO-S41]